MTDLPGPPAPPVFRAKPLDVGPPPKPPRRLVAANVCWVLVALSALPLAVLGRSHFDSAAAALYNRLIDDPSFDPTQTDALHQIANNGPLWLTYAQLLLGVVNLLVSVVMLARRSLSARTILLLTGTVTLGASGLWHVVVLAMSHSTDPTLQILSIAQFLLVVAGMSLTLGKDAKAWLRP